MKEFCLLNIITSLIPSTPWIKCFTLFSSALWTIFPSLILNLLVSLRKIVPKINTVIKAVIVLVNSIVNINPSIPITTKISVSSKAKALAVPTK